MSASDDPMVNHFDEVTGLLYLEGQLDEDHAREVAAHVASCPACGQLLRALEKESVWLRESLATDDEPIPAHLMSAPERNSAHWGWIAAFGLCAGGLYTLWNGIVAPSIAGLSQGGFSQGNVLTMLLFQGTFWKGWDAMRSLMEFLAMATLGSLVIWLLRKQWRHFTPIAFVMGAVAAALALPPAAAAADVEHGDPSYTLSAGQEIKNDLIVAADRTRIDGDVDGDLIVFSNSLTVNGHIKGDVLAFGSAVRVNGPVDGNVRVFCQAFSLSSAVGKNVTVWTGAFELDEKSAIGGSLMTFSGTSELNGKVAGDLLAYAGSLEINGSLGRNATIRGDRLIIGSTAEIQGQTKYTGRRPPEVASGAKLGSPIQVTIPKRGPDYSRVAYYWHRVLFWGASFLFGLMLLILAPGFYVDAGQAAKRVGPAVGFGILFLLATPIAAVIACVTIVGLGVGITAFLLWGIAIYAAQVFVASWVGEKLLGEKVGMGAAIGRLALGLAIIRVLTIIPYAGPLVAFCVVSWGIGAIVLALHRKVSPQLTAAA